MNYGQLKTAIAGRLSRNDLTSVIPDFISLGETRIYFGVEDPEVQADPLRLRAMLATETASLAALPDGFLECERFTVPGNYGPRVLTYKTPAEFANLATDANFPQYFTHQDGGVSVEGGTPVSFTFSYYKKFPAFDAETDTNWLLTNHPTVYFYSALIEAYQHVKNDARVPGAVRMYASAANAAAKADARERHSGSVLVMPTGNAV
jgi:hypothetical protein